jgi:two-component system OmpR family response regulator
VPGKSPAGAARGSQSASGGDLLRSVGTRTASGMLLPMSAAGREENEADATYTVVYVEDDERLARLTVQYLVSHGLEVFLVARGDQALSEVLRIKPDVVLLDVMLPGADGFEVCRRIRQHLTVPILMVTARGEETDRVLGLEGGADDYIGKPFSSRELVARIRAHARRARGQTGPRAERIEVGDLLLDPGALVATLSGRPLQLTSYEFSLLRVLAERAGRVLSREQLIALLHGSPDETFDRSIDVHISRLRQKLEDDPKNPRWLKTMRGVGYMLAAPPK